MSLLDGRLVGHFRILVEQTTLDYLDRAEALYEDVVGVVTDVGTEYTYGEFFDLR